MQKATFPGKIRLSLLAIVLGLGAQSVLACDEPTFNASIPDGGSASQEQMDQVFTKVSEFVKNGEAYIACTESSEGRAQATRLRNKMLDEMETVAAQFNRQLRLFKRANS